MEQTAEARFAEIYERRRDAVEAFVRRRVPADLVDDVVAETFLICWRKLGSVPAEALALALRSEAAAFEVGPEEVLGAGGRHRCGG
ncbi:MAG TPA: hypothetical protein VII51_05480 [Gaiellaceae bacterium]